MTEAALVVAVLAVPSLAAAAVWAAPSARFADRLALAAAALVAVCALALAAIALVAAPGVAASRDWFLLDPAAGVFLALIATVGLASAAVSPAYLRHAGRGWFSARRSHAWYYSAFFGFWAALIALPLVDNLALAWLLIEATTAASALLVAFSGSRSALEAGWKYVVLTTLGLAVALLGIVVLFAAADGSSAGLDRLDWAALEDGAATLPAQATLAAFVLIVAGLAGKIGWAPVHNWLPDAHSEAPPPVSAMLSAALLPTVLLIAWRTALALEPALGSGAAQQVFIGFGLASLAIAIPFLWRPLPWKRLLADSSLEHMGVLALGVGFGTPLALAGVVLHVAGHGVAKALGFYAAIPLLRLDPAAAVAPPRGVAGMSAPTAAGMAISLLALAGLPPSPLFVSELMVLLGGMQAGLLGVSALTAVLIALGFVGLAHTLVEGLLGDAGARGRRPAPRSARAVSLLAVVATLALLGLTVAAYALPDSGVVAGLVEGGG